MKTLNRFQLGALSLVLTTSFSVFAATAASPETQTNKEAPSELAAMLDIRNESSELHKSFLQRFGTQKQIQDRVDVAVAKIKSANKDGESSLISELHKQKICIPLDFGVSFADFIKLPFKAKVRGQRCVEPTNISGQQLLSDSYQGELRTLGIFKGRVMTRITFQKVFTGADSQMAALKSKVPDWRDVPKNSADVMERLEIGQTVRLEFEGELGAEDILDNTIGHLRKTGGVGYSKTGRFMIDIYHQSQTDVVARFTGMINRGRYSVNAGSDWRLLSGLLGRLLHGGLVGQALSASIGGDGEHSVIDTMMAEYRFSMRSHDAVDALDEIFGHILRREFVQPFLHQIHANENEEENFAQDLLKQASLAERFASEDKDLPHDQQRIEHKFRGRLITKILKVKPLEGHASLLVGGKAGLSFSTTDVRKYDKNNQLDFYVVENRHGYAEGQLINGRYSQGAVEDIDLLAKADAHGNPGQFLDLVKRNEYREGEFDQGNLAVYRKNIRAKVPTALASDEMIEDVLPKESQNSGTLVIEENIGSVGLAALQGGAGSYFALAFQRFMEAKGYEMPALTEGQRGNYLNEKGYDLAKLFDTLGQNAQDKTRAQIDAKNKAAFETFGRLKNDDDFRGVIVSEFVPTLLPQGQLKGMMSVNVQFTSNETHSVGRLFGEAKISEVFKNVRFMRKILEEEGSDLNLRLDEVSTSNSVK